jgi:biopolymer transport protein ExbD
MLLKKATEESPTINLTPMLDVVFNLIVFFMVGTKFVEMDHSMKLEVPTVSNAGPLISAPAKQEVHVYRSGVIMFNGREMTLAQLTQVLQQARREYPALSVLVRGDAEGRFQLVADALSAITQAGIEDTAICVRLGQGESTKR